jgi:hypothetical protein
LEPESGNPAIFFNPQLIKINVDSDNTNYVSENGVLFNKEKTTLLVYPSAKRSSSYVIPSSVKKIADYSFANAKFLTDVVLPDNLTDIGSSAFYSTPLLQKLAIPASVKNIGNSVFDYTNSLQSISVDPANQWFASLDGVLFNKDKSNLIIYPKAKSGSRYEVPASVKKISDKSFQYSTLTSVGLPNGLIEIGDMAFAFMPLLRNVIIPDTLETINNYAFYQSVKNTITIPNNVKTVGYQSIADQNDSGFIYCGSTLNVEELISKNSNKPNLCDKKVANAPIGVKATSIDESSAKVAVTAPENDGGSPILSYTVISNSGEETTVAAAAFAGFVTVNGLKPSTRYTFTVIATNIAGDSVSSNVSNAIITATSSSPENSSTGSLTIPCGGKATYKITNGVVSDGYDCSGDLIIDNRATSIGDDAFTGSKLGSVRLPDSVTSIGNYVFWNSTLTNLNIPEKVTRIGEVFLGQAKNIKSISLPKSLTSFGAYAFYEAYALESIAVDSENQNYVVLDGALLDKAKTKILNYPAGRSAASFTIPETVVEVLDYAFYGSAITSITIPKSLLNIGDYAIGKNTSLTNILVDPANPNYSLVNGWLYNSEKTKLMAATADKAVSNVVIPEGIKMVNGSVFGTWAKTVKTISIPASLENIDSYYIKDASSLIAINVHPENPNFSSVDGVLFSKDKSALLAYPALKPGTSYTIPNSVISMELFVLAKESNLTSINIPETLSSIYTYAFNDAVSLININVDPANPNYASADGVLFNKEIKNLITYPQGRKESKYVVPEGVTSIGNTAFFNAKNLKSISTPSTLYLINYNAFDGANSLKTISLGENTLLIATGAFTGTSALGYQYCGVEFSISEISNENTGLENLTNVCGKSLPGTVNVGAAKATGTTTATVAFTAPASDGGSPIISYTAISNTGVTTTFESSAASGEIVITGLSPATSYTFKLIATNLVGDSLTESASSNSVTTLKLTATVEDFANMTAVFAANPLTIAAPKSNSDGAWSFTSSDPKVVSVNGSALNMVMSGSVTITATQAATDMYAATTKTFTVEVKPYVLVKASKRTINVTVKGAKAVVKINGKAAKAGVNKVKAGKNLVTITIGGVKVYSKSFKVK